MKLIRPKEAASIFGVAVSSLRRWEEEGKIKAIKTPSGGTQSKKSNKQQVRPGQLPKNWV